MIHRYHFPLVSPFRTSSLALTHRDVLLLEVVDAAQGVKGYGESAPLVPFGTETYEESLDALSAIDALLATPPVFPLETAMELDARFPQLGRTPCARFAVETALLDLAAKRSRTPLRVLMGGMPDRRTVRVNAVISADGPAAMLTAARAAARDGFTCVKLKVGAQPPDVDLASVRAVRDAVGPEVCIRLDANGAWNREQARRMLEALAPLEIEYVEQPVPAEDVEGLAVVAARSSIPIAADEAVQSLAAASRLLTMGVPDVYILKPMAAGSLLGCRDFALRAAAAGKDTVFTTLIDAAVARRAVAHLAASLPDAQQRHHGLATGRLFVEDIARDTITRGCLEVCDE